MFSKVAAPFRVRRLPSDPAALPDGKACGYHIAVKLT